jgi:hypothetical protein
MAISPLSCYSGETIRSVKKELTIRHFYISIPIAIGFIVDFTRVKCDMITPPAPLDKVGTASNHNSQRWGVRLSN